MLTTKTEEGESGDIREGGVASDRLKIRQNQLKARKIDKARCTCPLQAKKQVRCEAGRSQVPGVRFV